MGRRGWFGRALLMLWWWSSFWLLFFGEALVFAFTKHGGCSHGKSSGLCLHLEHSPISWCTFFSFQHQPLAAGTESSCQHLSLGIWRISFSLLSSFLGLLIWTCMDITVSSRPWAGILQISSEQTDLLHYICLSWKYWLQQMWKLKSYNINYYKPI